MSFDPSSLFIELIVSSIGFVLLVYGKKQGRLPHLLAGLAYLVYPYFVPDWLWMAIVGAAIGGGLWWAVRQGY
ncbi:MAG TPA: hypothetical protein VLT86_18405 [Vicinamibacterales bacterium]|nr:hypothetical protein [Vicinamibacterales bacterium]